MRTNEPLPDYMYNLYTSPFRWRKPRWERGNVVTLLLPTPLWSWPAPGWSKVTNATCTVRETPLVNSYKIPFSHTRCEGIILALVDNS